MGTMLRRTFLAALAAAPVAQSKQHSRQIVLEGARNFRDIGGYPSMDGKHIRGGLVFRSDALHNRTDADYRKLARLRIRTVCDYRANAEREREPTKWRGSRMPEFQVLDIMAANPQNGAADPTATFIGRLMQPGATPETAAKMMADSMGDMALTGGPLYGRMMRRLLENEEPLLFHCSAGKDRTGLSTALLMKVLGVTQTAIYEDYLLVNTLTPAERSAPEMAERLAKMTGRPVDVSLLTPMLGTRREWLDSAFAAINGKFGSFDAYREKELSLTAADVARLRARLLQ
jgi:protein-tyrosine phosphatase